MVMIAKQVGQSGLKNADVFETFLMLKAKQLLPKTVQEKAKKADPTTQERLELLELEEVKKELSKTYFDRDGLAHVFTKYGVSTTGPQVTAFANNHAISNGLLVKVEKATFPKAGGKTRKATAYVLAEDVKHVGELVAYMYKA